MKSLHHFPSGSAGALSIVDGEEPKAALKFQRGSPTVHVAGVQRFCYDWLSRKGTGESTCLCHYRGCNTTEIPLSKKHTRNLKVLLTEEQNSTGIFAIIHKINQEQSSCKSLCLIRWQPSSRKAWSAKALQHRLSGTSSIFSTAFVTDSVSKDTGAKTPHQENYLPSAVIIRKCHSWTNVKKSLTA